MRRLPFALLAIFWTASCTSPDAIEVKDAWTRDTIGRTANAAIFMRIESSAVDRLTSASAPVARSTSLMTFEGGGGAMRMRTVPAIDIPANAPVSLDPNGLHVWLEGLHEPLKQGQEFPLALRFEKAGERSVTVKVIAPSGMPPMSGM